MCVYLLSIWLNISFPYSNLVHTLWNLTSSRMHCDINRPVSRMFAALWQLGHDVSFEISCLCFQDIYRPHTEYEGNIMCLHVFVRTRVWYRGRCGIEGRGRLSAREVSALGPFTVATWTPWFVSNFFVCKFSCLYFQDIY